MTKFLPQTPYQEIAAKTSTPSRPTITLAEYTNDWVKKCKGLDDRAQIVLLKTNRAEKQSYIDECDRVLSRVSRKDRDLLRWYKKLTLTKRKQKQSAVSSKPDEVVALEMKVQSKLNFGVDPMSLRTGVKKACKTS